MSVPTNSSIPARSRPGSTTAVLPTTAQGGSDKCAARAKPKPKLLRMAKQNLTVGTWNVRALKEDGRRNELEYELKRYN